MRALLVLVTLIAVGVGNAQGATHPTPELEHDIRPLMERRCLVCHGCYDAPCQLKLDSYQGLQRGASKETARLEFRAAGGGSGRGTVGYDGLRLC